MCCENTNHNFKPIKEGIECIKCHQRKINSNFGFDGHIMWIFTEVSCWLIAYILSTNLGCKLCGYRNSKCIYHIGISVGDKIIDIAGMHSVDEFKTICEDFICRNMLLQIEYGIRNADIHYDPKECYVEILDETEVKKILHCKIPVGKNLEDNLHYDLAVKCADKIIFKIQ